MGGGIVSVGTGILSGAAVDASVAMAGWSGSGGDDGRSCVGVVTEVRMEVNVVRAST